MSLRTTWLLLLMAAAGPLSMGQREPALKQIDLPHPYYYREMYLPQLTTGPSEVAWCPSRTTGSQTPNSQTGDSQTLIYSMAGSLWRQRLDLGTAEQLTANAGYDYQPDCSRDGRWVVYVSYYKDAIEVYVLDVQTGRSQQLTKGGNVNVEPRFSPDGKRIAFVSTAYNRRFHIFVADFTNGVLSNIQRLTGETRSTLPRYYYSAFDTEISPTWSPDGSEIIFVSNRGHIYGSGGLWRMKAQPGTEAHEIHYEETTWKARPDWSPDGKRLVYASYLGQQWHQLWTVPAKGGDPFPLSYGQFDNTAPRWSPDGKRIAFISNRSGNTTLWVQEVPGGNQTQVGVRERHYLRPMGSLGISVLDTQGHPTPARVSVIGPDAKAYAPDDTWMHADDSLDLAQAPFEVHYFHSSGESEVTVPVGEVMVEVMKGFESQPAISKVQVAPNQRSAVALRLQPIEIPHTEGSRWASADLHVHMNYAGTYRNTPENLVRQGAAENLALVEDLVVNKEQRIPDIAYFRSGPDGASTATTLLMHSQEFHTSYWGHLGLLNLTRNFLLPGYAGYPNTSAASLFPTNAAVADLAHAQLGLVGYVHPFDSYPDPANPALLTDELPVDVALGKVDYIEVLGFSDHKSTAAVWYRLLNCGFRMPTGAGTDAMANFAQLRGPVGLNRVYAAVPDRPLNADVWLNSLRKGRTFATNGPLLGLALGDQAIGGEVKLASGQHEVKFTAWLRSIVPVDHFEIICNGEVARSFPMGGSRDRVNVQGTLSISKSGWCVARAWSEKEEHPILDIYPYATTSPIYISVGGSPVRSPKDAAYFAAWIDRLVQSANANHDWNTAAEKATVLRQLSDARAVYGRQVQ